MDHDAGLTPSERDHQRRPKQRGACTVQPVTRQLADCADDVSGREDQDSRNNRHDSRGLHRPKAQGNLSSCRAVWLLDATSAVDRLIACL